MSVAAQTLRPPSRTLMFLEGRALHELGAFVGALPLLSLAPRGDGHPVLTLPGFLASDLSMAPMRRYLGELGYDKGQLRYPAGIAVSGSKIYIANRENGRIDTWTS